MCTLAASSTCQRLFSPRTRLSLSLSLSHTHTRAHTHTRVHSHTHSHTHMRQPQLCPHECRHVSKPFLQRRHQVRTSALLCTWHTLTHTVTLTHTLTLTQEPATTNIPSCLKNCLLYTGGVKYHASSITHTVTLTHTQSHSHRSPQPQTFPLLYTGGIKYVPVPFQSKFYALGSRFGFTAFSICLGSSYFQVCATVNQTVNEL